MRRFSRWMPPLKPKAPSLLEWCVLPVLGVIGVGAYLCYLAVMAVLCVLFSPLLIFEYFYYKGERERFEAERARDDIGTFARSFDRRTEPFDPWVIRATWDAFSPYLDFPLRATDRIEDLPIDPDDNYLCLIGEIAERSRHALGKSKGNPYLAKVETVGDLVRAITWQPRLEEPALSECA